MTIQNPFDRLSSWLRQVSKGWVAFACLVIFLLFTALVLPAQASKADAPGEEVGSPDLSFYYSAEELYRMAEAYGEQGRSEYVRARFTFDLVWPLVYTAFLVSALSWVYGKAFPPGSAWQRANLAPLAAALLDLLENLSTSLVMLRYPQPTPLIDTLAPVFTALKWVFVSASFLLLLVGVAAAVWRWATGFNR
jgi:hypothetical protein